MSDDHFRIFVEQLREGHTEEIDETFPPAFLDVHEKELVFTEPVTVKGEVYLAEDTLVLHLDIEAVAEVPCSVCNKPVEVPISIEGFYHAVPVNEIKGAVYDFSEVLRETILLEVPHLAECREGKCPQRKTIGKYLKKEKSPGSDDDGEGYRPFADLDFKVKDK